MNIKPIEDNDSDFEAVYINKGTPHCKKHGAMNKVTVFPEGGGYWRCIHTISKHLDNTCRTGCIQYKT